LSNCWGTTALSSGNRVPRVLPMPVLAWAIRQRPPPHRLYGFRPVAAGLGGALGRGKPRLQASVALGQALLLALAQARKRWHWVSKTACRLGGAVALTDHRLAIAVDVQVHQRHLDAPVCRLAATASRPWPGPSAAGGGCRLAVRATVGLDLFQALLRRVVAVGAARAPAGPRTGSPRHFGS
jgi:hypothetical protein